MKIKRKIHGDVMVLALSGKILGGADHEKFQTEIKAIIAEGYLKIVLDFSGVPYINSCGVGILASAFTTLQRHDGQMKICNLKKRDLSILYVTQLLRAFEVHDSLQSALDSYTQDEQVPHQV
jgi:anti-sigma B factor antagonist